MADALGGMHIERLDEAVAAALAWADGQDSAFDRLAATRLVVERLRHWGSIEVAGVQRTRIVRELSAQGWSYRQIAEMAGVSVARVQQWIAGER